MFAPAENDTYYVNAIGGHFDESVEVLRESVGLTDTSAYSAVLTEESLAQLTENLPTPDEGRIYRETVEAYAENLKNGVITEEGYDELMEAVKQWATEVDPDKPQSLDPETEAEKDFFRANS